MTQEECEREENALNWEFFVEEYAKNNTNGYVQAIKLYRIKYQCGLVEAVNNVKKYLQWCRKNLYGDEAKK